MPTLDVETLLDRGPLRPIQRRVIALSVLGITFDGVDIQIIGLAVPTLAQDWATAPEAFASVAAAGLAGMALGTSIVGTLGDRFGNKRMLGMSIFLLGVMTLASGLARDLTDLTILRFVSGIGMGGALPNAVALVSGYSPLSRRAFWLAALSIATQAGGVLAGLMAAEVLPSMGWRALFFIAGGAPLLLGIVILIWVPETIHYLLRRGTGSNGELEKIVVDLGGDAIAPQHLITHETCSVAGIGAFSELFGAGRWKITVILWTMFVSVYLSMYMVPNWLPTIFVSEGLSAAEGSFGLAIYNIAGIFAGLTAGAVVARFGTRIPLLIMVGGGLLWSLALALILGQITLSAPVVILLVSLLAFSIIGALVSIVAIAAAAYRPELRSTGAGAALTAARIGAVLSSFLGAGAIAVGGAPLYFVIIAIGLAVAGVCVAIFPRHAPASPSRGQREPTDFLQRASS